MKDTNLPFIIGQGLKAIDRMAAAEAMQSVIFALIQAPMVAQQFDLAAMIDFWSSMIDIDMDMKQFRIASPAEAAAQQKDPAAAAAAEGGGNPIQPATAPEAVTAPIYS
jgi:hypothetical protein